MKITPNHIKEIILEEVEKFHELEEKKKRLIKKISLMRSYGMTDEDLREHASYLVTETWVWREFWDELKHEPEVQKIKDLLTNWDAWSDLMKTYILESADAFAYESPLGKSIRRKMADVSEAAYPELFSPQGCNNLYELVYVAFKDSTTLDEIIAQMMQQFLTSAGAALAGFLARGSVQYVTDHLKESFQDDNGMGGEVRFWIKQLPCKELGDTVAYLSNIDLSQFEVRTSDWSEMEGQGSPPAGEPPADASSSPEEEAPWITW